MSLLLDALKKAAEEKQQKENTAEISESKDDFDLTLPSVEKKENEPVLSENELNEELEQLQEQEQYSVSKEALNLLIHKTNHKYRKRKVVWVSLIILLSLTILASGGMYFMQTMQNEVVILEEQHVKTLSLLKKRTNKEDLSTDTMLMKSLLSDSSIEEKVAFAKESIVKIDANVSSNLNLEKPVRLRESRDALQPKVKSSVKKFNSALVIEKTESDAPVSVALDKAWLRYDAGDYIRAKELYEKVIKIEPRQRDALFGLGVLSSLEGNNEEAKDYYTKILKENPNDEEVISALVNVYGADEQAENYLKGLILKNKKSSVLNYSLGNIYAQMNKWKAAQAVYFIAWVNDDKNLIYAYNLAVSLDQLGRQSEAIRFYKASLELAKIENNVFIQQKISNRLKQMGVVGNESSEITL